MQSFLFHFLKMSWWVFNFLVEKSVIPQFPASLLPFGKRRALVALWSAGQVRIFGDKQISLVTFPYGVSVSCAFYVPVIPRHTRNFVHVTGLPSASIKHFFKNFAAFQFDQLTYN